MHQRRIANAVHRAREQMSARLGATEQKTADPQLNAREPMNGERPITDFIWAVDPVPEREDPDHREAGTWLARDGDDRVLEVDTAGYPGAEASPGDGRPVAETAAPAAKRELDLLAEAAEAEEEQRFADEGHFADRWDGPIPPWEKSEAEVHDWEAEAG